MRLGVIHFDQDKLEATPSLSTHDFAKYSPPDVLIRGGEQWVPLMGLNDVLPDCVAVGIANAASLSAAIAGYKLNVDEEKIPFFYAAVEGCEPVITAIAQTDGVQVLDALAYQAAHGMDVMAHDQTPLVCLYGKVDRNETSLAQTMQTIGHVLCVFNLYDRDMDLSTPGWDVADGRDDGALVGEHCVVIVDYAGLRPESTVRIATWGQFRTATWAWVADRIVESYALVWRQLQAPGVSFDALEAALLVDTGAGQSEQATTQEAT